MILPAEEIQRLRTFAYNILGSYEDAKDVVQDVLVKQLEHPAEEPIANPKAYLTKSVINQAISIKKRNSKIVREAYIGAWLPEPVTNETADGALLSKEMLQYSVLVLMEKLSPKERAVFVLKEAFNYSHQEIATTLDITEDNSRQLLKRGKNKVDGVPAVQQQVKMQEEAQRFFSAILNADVATLEHLLVKDIVMTSDGGGKATASRWPVAGKERVIKALLGLYHKHQKLSEAVPAIVNGQPAFLFYDNDVLVNCQILEFSEAGLQNVYFVRNPDKLKALHR